MEHRRHQRSRPRRTRTGRAESALWTAGVLALGWGARWACELLDDPRDVVEIVGVAWRLARAVMGLIEVLG